MAREPTERAETNIPEPGLRSDDGQDEGIIFLQPATEFHSYKFSQGEKFFRVSGTPLPVEGIQPTFEKASNDEKDYPRSDANGEDFHDP